MALLALACLTCTSVSGTVEPENPYPIDPVPLRLLCERADVIALVEVQEIDVRYPDGADEGFPEFFAELKVLEPILGSTAGAKLEVPHAGGMICPTPPHYEKGLKELVFLEKLESGTWRTVSLSYGTIHGDEAKMKSFLKAVRNWPGLKEWEDLPTRRKAEVDWILDLAADPQTRWDGVCELMPLDSGMAFMDWPFRGMDLDKEQRETLIAAWTSRPTFAYADHLMFQLFADDKDARIDAWLEGYLRTWFTKEPYGYEDILHQAVIRWGSPEAMEFFQKHWQIDPNPRDDSWEFAGYGRDEEERLHHLLRMLLPI
ncbi:MAG: hypothetical protein ACPG31_10375 [Planctomycetota bacterium]